MRKYTFFLLLRFTFLSFSQKRDWSVAILVFFLICFFPLSTCNAQAAGCKDSINLVINSNFNGGNSGFTSTLVYGINCYPGYYYVGTNMQNKCSIWPASFVDHTSGTGNLLIVDGDDTYGPQDIWIENLPVISNITYTFSFWAKNLYLQQPFPLGFMIGGTQVATSSLIAAGSWNQYSITWTAQITGIVPVAIRQITGGAYRDLGIDDVFFGFCRNEPVGIAPTKEDRTSVTVFPNPGNSNFSVSGIDLPIEINFYNLTGEKLLNMRVENGDFHLSLPSGLYFVELFSNEKRTITKIILE